MEKSKVYFSDLRTDEISTLDKLKRLMKASGFEQIDFQGKYVAVKVHFGEPGNMAYLRPNWARVVCDYIKGLGGKPFLTDCNTLYVGGRANALDHLDSAMRNGYTPLQTGVQCIIADGLKGTDYDLVPIRGGKYLRAAKIGRAIMDADIIVSLSHAKGHVSAGFGGALKNLGMGSGSRAGKMDMHSSGKPVVNQARCIGCGKCIKNCAHGAPRIENGKCTILKAKCTGCGRCVGVCPVEAIHAEFDTANDVLNCKIAEYAKAVCDGRPNFHIALAVDVSPECDCHAYNDVPIVPNVGMFASFDPVALDAACADAINAQPANPGCAVPGSAPAHDHFSAMHPDTNWRAAVEHGEAIGLGSAEYELVKI